MFLIISLVFVHRLLGRVHFCDFFRSIMDTTPEKAAQAVALLEAGVTQRQVARRLQISRSSVQRAYRRYLETGAFNHRPGMGRPRATSAADDRFIQLTVLRNRRLNAVQVQQSLRDECQVVISSDTVRRRLAERNLTPKRAATGPALTVAHRRARLEFAREHRDWSVEQWGNVLFTDETRVSLHGSDRRQRVYRRPGERYSQCCIEETVAYGGGSLMAWGGISLTAHTALVFIEPTGRTRGLTSHRYITEILEDHVVPYAGYIGQDMQLMHDNARPHVAHVVTQYLHDVGIRTMDWPARSPDMNPIEHLWDELKRRVRARVPAPSRLPELRMAMEEEWNAIPQDFIVRLVRSMNSRMLAVIRARGGNTKY